MDTNKKIETAAVSDTLNAAAAARKPASNAAAQAQQQAAKPVTDERLDLANDESGTEIGVEDEISYTVAEGSVNPDLANASGLFGGLAAAGAGPLGLAAAGLAGLALLGGGGGGGGETPTESPTMTVTMTMTMTTTGGNPGGVESTGVLGAADAGAEGAAMVPGAGEPLAGALGTIATGIDQNSGTFTSQDPSGTVGPGAEAVIGQQAAPTDAQGNILAPNQDYGLIGGLATGGAPAEAAAPLIAARDQIAAQDASALPGGTQGQEALLDTLGASAASPTPASAGSDLPLADTIMGAASGISSVADPAQLNNLPLPPAV